MQASAATELILIRHAPALTGGRLCGRTDVAADLGDGTAARALARALGGVGRLIASPALRCRQTAGALWPDLTPDLDPALWEQDFGDWDGRPLADVPDLGPMTRPDLARHHPPGGGESFADLVARVTPALTALGPGLTVVVAHAGTIRAGLSLALRDPADALGVDIAPLSASRIVRHGADWSLGYVNRIAPWP